MAELYSDMSRHIVVMKGTQLGITEYAVNRSLWFLENCGDVLYVLPSKEDAGDFSAGRINPSIDESPHLERFFTDVDNVGHKRAGNRNYYLRGSNSRSKLKSVPIDFLVLDEYDEMVQKNIPLARDRMDASSFKWELNISTPTYPEMGIDASFAETDQHKWLVTCGSCNHEQEMVWPDNIDLENEAFVCAKCGRDIGEDRWLGRWVATNPGADIRGYHVSQLLSPTVSAAELCQEWRAAQGEPYRMENFYNAKLGLPYVAAGEKLTQQDIEGIIGEYTGAPLRTNGAGMVRTMGVDVGGDLHYFISDQLDGKKKVIKVGRADSFEEVARIIGRWRVRVCVVDSRPETRKAEELIDQVNNCYVALCDYRDDYRDRFKLERDKNRVTVDRTYSLDGSLGRVYMQSMTLPQDLPKEEVAEHFTNVVRVLEEKSNTQATVARYRRSGPDHYAHANNYDDIALMVCGEMGLGLGANPDAAALLRGMRLYEGS